MPGWLRSVGSGPLIWMLSNATSTAWIDCESIGRQSKTQHERRRSQSESNAARTANATKEQENEDQNHEPIRGRSGQRPTLLHGGTGFSKKNCFQPGPISLPHSVFPGGPRRY